LITATAGAGEIDRGDFKPAERKGPRLGAIVGQGLGDLQGTPLSVPGSR